MEIEAEEEVLVEEVFGLQHGAHTCGETEGGNFIGLTAIGNFVAGGIGLVVLAGVAEEGAEVDTRSKLEFDVVVNPVGQRQTQVDLEALFQVADFELVAPGEAFVDVFVAFVAEGESEAGGGGNVVGIFSEVARRDAEVGTHIEDVGLIAVPRGAAGSVVVIDLSVAWEGDGDECQNKKCRLFHY